MPLAFYPLVRLGRHVRASSETSLRRWRDISEILQETISGFRVVKAFGMEGFETARFRRAASRLFHVNMRITRTTAFLPPLMEAVGGLALVGALFYGSDAIRSGHLTAGAFTSFLAALFAMYTPIKRLSRLNATLQGAMAAAARDLRGARHPPRGAGCAGRAVRCRASQERDRIQRAWGSSTPTGTGARAAQRLASARARARWWPSWARAARARPRS